MRKVVWAGANEGSYLGAQESLQELANASVAMKQVRRLTTAIGEAAVEERDKQVLAHSQRPLMERLTAPANGPQPDCVAVLMDGGRYQRRDGFAPRGDHPDFEARWAKFVATDRSAATHWREDRVGLVLSLASKASAVDPHPEFPAWLASADVVRELAKLAARDEQPPPPERRASRKPSRPTASNEDLADDPAPGWPDVAPRVLSRELVASGRDAESFGRLLEYQAWRGGVHAAKRGAFVADGLAVNWTIHQRHFSQLTGVLDLMHALSYAWRAAESLKGSSDYARFALCIWQGRVDEVIAELEAHPTRLEPAADDASPENLRRRDELRRIAEAITYYRNHQHLMNYPEYRRQGLPLTSSHIESAVKQISTRVKGTDKFWTTTAAEALLQLRADSLSDSRPLDRFWTRYLDQLAGANRYRQKA